LTWQGANDSSAWARGQSWGLYGFTMMYRLTKDSRYLDQAKKIASFLLSHPNLPSDKIPYWDYNAPGIPNALRDVSAGTVMASALLELAQYSSKKEKSNYLNVAETILLSLGSENYLSANGDNGGFLLKHSVGSIPHKSELDVSLTYADYYFLEALERYQKWYLKN
jgi:rhamnogalacturonyl hydrolase YesR